MRKCVEHDPACASIGAVTTQPPAPPRLRLLIDTNVCIAVEPYAGTLEPQLTAASELLRLVNQQGHRILVHPATRDDLLEGQDAARRTQRLAELKKFEMLDEVPVPAALTARAGVSEPGSNDHRDLRLLAALNAHAVTYLVSEDARLHRRAQRAGLEGVLGIDETVHLLRGFIPSVVPPPPRVEPIAAYALDTEQRIFDSLRADYDGFDKWLDKIRADSENRDCLIVRDPDGQYAALALIKRQEPDCAYPIRQPVRKIATFKVAERHGRNKYGELLLKAIFSSALPQDVATLYVTVLPKHQPLIDFFHDFGFKQIASQTELNELILTKPRRLDASADRLSPLQHHVRYGPPALDTSGRLWIVPIRPVWHQQLFPDAPNDDASTGQLVLPGLDRRTQTHPWGNALRKAYLCNSNVGGIAPGDTVLFYRSLSSQAVLAVGVVEDTLRSADPNEILSFVGRRTVYTPVEVASLCRSVRGCLAIMFRQDRFIDPPWLLSELQQHGVLTKGPQSIKELRGRGATWVRSQLEESL
jgi:L-amino acid N-acyltransferase YncA